MAFMPENKIKKLQYPEFMRLFAQYTQEALQAANFQHVLDAAGMLMPDIIDHGGLATTQSAPHETPQKTDTSPLVKVLRNAQVESLDAQVEFYRTIADEVNEAVHAVAAIAKSGVSREHFLPDGAADIPKLLNNLDVLHMLFEIGGKPPGNTALTKAEQQTITNALNALNDLTDKTVDAPLSMDDVPRRFAQFAEAVETHEEHMRDLAEQDSTPNEKIKEFEEIRELALKLREK